MTVTLSKAYGGAPAGAVRDFSSELEAALIAQKLAVSGGTLTTGAQTTDGAPVPWGPVVVGVANVAIAASSVVITNANITAQMKGFAVVAQAAADGTALRVERVVCGAGTLTIHVTAGATASTRVSYAVFP